MSEITAEQLLTVLSRHIGADRGAHIHQLVAELGGAGQITERRVRRLIVELRQQGHHVCALPETGYFLAADEAELLRTCGYLYDRAITSLTQIAAMRRVSLPDLRGQLRIDLEQP